MSLRTVKARWARKLLKSKYFVVLTDKESCIALDGAEVESFTDTMALSAQATELQMFHDKLGELIKAHTDAVDRLSGQGSQDTNVATNRKPRRKTVGSGGSKIKVREG